MTERTANDIADIRNGINSETQAPNPFEEQMGLG